MGGRVEDAVSRVDAEAVRVLQARLGELTCWQRHRARGRLLSIARDSRRAGSDHDERRGHDRGTHPRAVGRAGC